MKLSQMKSVHLAWLLLLVSLILYSVDYMFFGRAGEIGFGFLGNLAFLPIYVLFVTLMIERILRERERLAIRRKLNMVIGAFFSEVGTELLRDLSDFLADSRELIARLKVSPQWTDRDFNGASAFLASHDLAVDSRMGDLQYLRHFLMGKREFMLGLLENPNLMEHDDFTDLLWAVFHLVEELTARRSLEGLPGSDLDHLTGDIKRAYGHLLREWVAYMRHLRQDYPYLFSLAVRMNPMDQESRPEVY